MREFKVSPNKEEDILVFTDTITEATIEIRLEPEDQVAVIDINLGVEPEEIDTKNVNNVFIGLLRCYQTNVDIIKLVQKVFNGLKIIPQDQEVCNYQSEGDVMWRMTFVNEHYEILLKTYEERAKV